MPTSFIALQCFQCSTMQVKQQKKSSNKWSCVVCNEKQSVRKVFARASMAKDVRKFVQNFNMSRQLADQKQYLSEEHETLDAPEEERKRKRNDWTEYVDDQEECCGQFDKNGDLAEGNDGIEPMVVTEMPKVLFKKPKVKGYSSSHYGDGTLMRPQFRNKSSVKRHQNVNSQGAEWTEVEEISREEATKNDRKEPMALQTTERDMKWNRFRAQIQDGYSSSANREKPFQCEPVKVNKKSEKDGAAKGAVSKWSAFITEEDDDDTFVERRGRRGSWDRVSKGSNHQLGLEMNGEKVEDDIHPDFL